MGRSRISSKHIGGFGSGEMVREDVDLAIRTCFPTDAGAVARSHSRSTASFPLPKACEPYAGMASASVTELARLVDVFTEHELGHVPITYASFLRELSDGHELGVAFLNIYAPKQRWLREFERAGIDGVFRKLVFSEPTPGA